MRVQGDPLGPVRLFFPRNSGNELGPGDMSPARLPSIEVHWEHPGATVAGLASDHLVRSLLFAVSLLARGRELLLEREGSRVGPAEGSAARARGCARRRSGWMEGADLRTAPHEGAEEERRQRGGR